MKLLKWIIGFTFIAAGILGNVIGVMEWMEIPFMRGLLNVILGLIMLGIGAYIIADRRNSDG